MDQEDIEHQKDCDTSPNTVLIDDEVPEQSNNESKHFVTMSQSGNNFFDSEEDQESNNFAMKLRNSVNNENDTYSVRLCEEMVEAQEDMIKLSEYVKDKEEKHATESHSNVDHNEALETAQKEAVNDIPGPVEEDMAKQPEEKCTSSITDLQEAFTEKNQKCLPLERQAILALSKDIENVMILQKEELQQIRSKFSARLQELYCRYHFLEESIQSKELNKEANVTDDKESTEDDFKCQLEKQHAQVNQENIEMRISRQNLQDEIVRKTDEITNMKGNMKELQTKLEEKEVHIEQQESKLRDALARISKLEKEILERESFHQQTYLITYKKGMMAAKFEHQCEMADQVLTEPTSKKIVQLQHEIEEKENKLKKKDEELEKLKKLFCTQRLSKSEVTLNFIRDAFYYYAINVHAQENLQAILTLLSYDPEQRTKIEQALTGADAKEHTRGRKEKRDHKLDRENRP